jgi:hypothetical protein
LTGPLLTASLHGQLLAAARGGGESVACSVDLGWSTTSVAVDAGGWTWRGVRYPFMERCRERTVYHWTGAAFEPVARFGAGLVKLVPTDWGPPTFEIDGIKMLPTKDVSPLEDARAKAALVEPRGRTILDTCGGLGYVAAGCVELGAARVLSFERSPEVLWLRGLNPWSPPPGGVIELVEGDVLERIGALPDAAFDAILHDPPRFGIAGELYSLAFYRELARVLRPGGLLFHYTGSPNRLTSGRDVPAEVMRRLARAGFTPERALDGVLAVRTSPGAAPRRRR